MAGSDKHSKTEKPTGKRKNEARKKGTIPKSPELSAWISLLIVSFVLPHVFKTGQSQFQKLLREAQDAMSNPSIPRASHVMRTGLMTAAHTVMPLAITVMIAGIIINISQVGFVFTLKPLKPKWERLNPKNGIKKIFSVQGAWELMKQIIKLGLFAFIAWKSVRNVATRFAIGGPFNVPTMLNSLSHTIITFLRYVSLLGVVLALIDYAIVRRKIGKSLMMTKHEVKEEGKQSEGNPFVKQEIRKRMAMATMNRMMSAMRTADVVVTNPTHYAIAIKYEASKGAPKVVAKGADEVAKRMREVAMENKVPLVEDPPLARTLFRLCDINDEVPRDLFEAVAKLLAFIFNLKRAGATNSYGVALKPPRPFLANEILDRPKRAKVPS